MNYMTPSDFQFAVNWRIAELKAENAALRKDAARYRYVRAKPEMLLHLSNKDFDAAIDAAMLGENHG